MSRRAHSANLGDCLKELLLPTVRAVYEEMAAHARQESLSYKEFLLEVLERECESRR